MIEIIADAGDFEVPRELSWVGLAETFVKLPGKCTYVGRGQLLAGGYMVGRGFRSRSR